MEVKFKETNIPNDLSTSISTIGYSLGEQNVDKIAFSLFGGVSTYLGKHKSTTVPIGVVFNSVDNSFIAGAKVEYIKNTDDSDPAAGHWNYSWTTNAADMEDSSNSIVGQQDLLYPFFSNYAFNHYHMRFIDASTCYTMMVILIEMIVHFVKENTKPNDAVTLTLDGAFKAIGEVDSDGSIVVAIIPDGDMKVLVKDDSAIQSQ